MHVINAHITVSDLREKWDHGPADAMSGFRPELQEVTWTCLELNFELKETQYCPGGLAE